MPVVRPFRALRYSPEVIPDLAAVTAPPYDVIDAEERARLVARDPRNVVRLDLPVAEAGDPDPDERYRRAARLLAAWRSDGTLRRDPRPAVSVVEEAYRLPRRMEAHVRRGFFARVRLEPVGGGIRAHERTMSGPREDRYRLLRAAGVNTSPVVAMYDDPSGRVAELLEAVAAGPPLLEVTDDQGVQRRLWTVPADDASPADELCELASRRPLTIADGHHRYETALRHRDERRVGVADDAELDLDFVLMLLFEPRAGRLDILPTHRILRGLGEPGVATLLGGISSFFDVEARLDGAGLEATFGPDSDAPGGEGRFGLWTRGGGLLLRARRDAPAALLAEGGPALRRLDVSLLAAAIEALAGIDAAAVAAGERIAYTKDARRAIEVVRAGSEGADAAFLLDPTPAAEIMAVAAEGDVMPQKSTYIYPKALTGLVINPLEG
ncbi:MAG: DUF1015 domain-containing protein [Chloroflexi bacterium]|nr:DUF1015 domain-containing protein [Chloroflexota bacterium]